jgi:hypothetical protein
MPNDHHPDQLIEDEVAIFRVDALLDAIIDGRPWRVRTTCGSCSLAPSASTGGPATHRLRPRQPPGSRSSWSWATPWPRPCTWTRCGPTTRPTTPEEVRPMRGCGCLVTAMVGLFLGLFIAGSLLTSALS